jgi:hypothetical protein
MPIQTAADSISNSAGSPFGFKNRIINGAMVIDQRNVGNAVASSTSAYAYMTDKFAVASSTDGGVSSQQVSDAPTGFTKSLKVTVTTADSSLSAAQRTVINHGFEGLNMADLNWGTNTAKSVTLSFWVKSSVTGTFSVSFRTGNAGTSYTAPYTIIQANTWEYETITIPGATIGTWVTDNTTWAYLIFSLGIGSDYNTGTLNSWVSVSNGQGSTSHTSLMSTLNATWQVTGVQLEVGTQATSFDYRPYGAELQLCQRYFEKTYLQSEVPGANYDARDSASRTYSFGDSTAQSQPFVWNFKVSKRAAPTVNIYNPFNGTANQYRVLETGTNMSAQVIKNTSTETCTVASAGAGLSSNYRFDVHITAASEL